MKATRSGFNEPTPSFEWSRNVFRLARAHGLYNTFVTNGCMAAAALGCLVQAGLDAMNVDIKGIRCFADLDRLTACKRLDRVRARPSPRDGLLDAAGSLEPPSPDDSPSPRTPRCATRREQAAALGRESCGGRGARWPGLGGTPEGSVVAS
jgi:hypothetical protein